MALIELFFRQEVIIRPYLRRGAGESIYGKPETRKCRLERGIVLNNAGKKANGDIKVAPRGSRMYCVGSPIPVGSIVEDVDRDYIVTDCKELYTFANHHLEVMLE